MNTTRIQLRFARSGQRGVAMLLVIISLMMATILTMAYVASRDNSAVIGTNVTASANARWASMSGIDMGVAILQTEIDWRTKHVNGKLIDDYAIGDALIDLDVVDLATNTPPTESTTDVMLTSTAVVNGVEQVSTATASIRQDETTVAVDLSEFAVFGATAISMSNNAVITRWPKSPLAELGRRLFIGTQATSAGSISLSDSSAVVDVTVMAADAASASLVTKSGSQSVKMLAMPDPIPMPGAPSSGVAAPSGIVPTNVFLNGSSQTMNTTRRVGFVVVQNGGNLKLDNATLIANTDFTMANNSTVVVNGNSVIVAFNDVKIEASSIELNPGATLKLYIGKDFELKDSYIGDLRADSTRDNSGNAGYMDPMAIQIYTIDSTEHGTRDWRLVSNSVVKSSMYAPKAEVRVRDDSALYGRLAACSVRIDGNGAVFYDPALDTRVGYTNPNSNLYNNDRTIKNEFKAIASLDEAVLRVASGATGKLVRSNGVVMEAAGIVDTLINTLLDVLSPTEPTPRDVPVDVKMYSFGSSIADWEADVQ